MKHSDFIVYVDESGDHSLRAINPRYPLFVLALCVLEKSIYTHHVAPALRQLKFATFGHDMVVLHESEIRKRLGAFAGMGREQCESFLARLTELIDQANFHVIATVIDKRKLDSAADTQPHAYHVALGTSLEALFQRLRDCDQDGCVTHVVCEARGAKEDAELSLEFERLCDVGRYAQRGIHFQLVIADKKTNSEGLQLADLIARPIGLSVLRPGQPNRAVGIIMRKLAASSRDAAVSGLRLLP